MLYNISHLTVSWKKSRRIKIFLRNNFVRSSIFPVNEKGNLFAFIVEFCDILYSLHTRRTRWYQFTRFRSLQLQKLLKIALWNRSDRVSKFCVAFHARLGLSGLPKNLMNPRARGWSFGKDGLGQSLISVYRNSPFSAPNGGTVTCFPHCIFDRIFRKPILYRTTRYHVECAVYIDAIHRATRREGRPEGCGDRHFRSIPRIRSS